VGAGAAGAGAGVGATAATGAGCAGFTKSPRPEKVISWGDPKSISGAWPYRTGA